jgi:NAD(P)-dependent dehydrogenase (short-subunit alcohol dehydrogenase family)
MSEAGPMDDNGGSLTGSVAVVTGASREIGAAIAEILARRGAAVLVAHYREPELAEATVARIRAAGGTALAHDGDCSMVAETQAMIARAVREFGRLDVFVANAGLTMWAPFLEYTEAAWDTVIDLNLKGSFFGAQAASQQMIRQGTPGSIVFSASVTGVQAIPYLSAYGISKAGLRQMARCLALELGPHHISVNALGIGPTLNARNLEDDPDYDAHWGSVSPAGRAARPEDVARALLFLVENRYITGETLMVDGGWTIHSPTPRLDFVETKK